MHDTGAPTAPPTHDAVVAPLLAERVRVGLWILIATLCAFAIADGVLHPHLVLPLWSIAGVQIATTAIGLRILRNQPSFGVSVAVTLTSLGVQLVTGTISDIVSNNIYGAPVYSIVMALATGTLLPWGVRPQVVLVTIAGSAALVVTYCVRGAIADVGHIVVGAMAIFLTSIAMAHSSTRIRQRQIDADHALALAKTRAEEEADVASRLVAIGQALAARLGQEDLLAVVTRLAQEALPCDVVGVIVLDPRRDVFRSACVVGLPDELAANLQQIEFPKGAFPLFEPTHVPGLVDVPDFAAQTTIHPHVPAYFGITSALLAPLVRSGRLQGVLCFAHRGRLGAAPARACRLATGIAQATTVALDNAQLIADLEAASRLKSEFVATMSHELRTPLNVIIGYTEMLRDEDGDISSAGHRDAVLRIDRSARELHDLVSSTLDLGRLEAGRALIERQIVDLTALVASLVPDVEPLVQPAVALEWYYADLPTAVTTDAAKVRTILKNLIGNALKFTPTGTVEVTVRWANDELAMVVRDTGVGMSPEQLPVIFDMFRQVDATATRRFGGVGLGLHIVHRLCGLLGGSVTVESALGEGSTFSVRLPAKAAAPAAETQAA